MRAFVVSFVLKVSLQRSSSFVETCFFLSSRYYHSQVRSYRVWGARYYRPHTAVIFYCRRGERYYRFGAVLPPERYYRDDMRYYRAVIDAWG